MRHGLLLVLIVCTGALAASPFPLQSPPASPPPIPDVQVDWGLKIPLRDGVTLNATRYRARGDTTAQPCIFTLTPYISQNYHDRGMYFGANGYVFLTVDARGRGNSEGAFTPLLQEAKDGHDVVEWLAKQDFCNGKVTMWGGSYAGYNQWAAAKEFPRGLATIVPVASPFAGVDFPMSDNMFYPYDIQWLTLTAGRASQDKIFGDAAYWESVYAKLYREHRAFRELDTLAGMPSKHFQTWIVHPSRDAFWDRYNPTAAQYAKIDLPILSVTGHYDGDQPGALEHYRQHMDHASAKAREQHYLVIGPWDHPGTRTPQAEVGGLTFGSASVVDMNAVHKAWYDWTLKNGPKPEFLQDAVAYYVTGAEEWRYAPSLESVTGSMQTWALASDSGGANDVFNSGQLAAAPGGGPDRYVYDPLDVRAAELSADTNVAGLVDQRYVYRNRGGTLIYHSAPFDQPVDVAGFFEFNAHIAIDQPDTDIEVGVFDIAPDGSSRFLAADARRARYRTDARRAELAKPGVIEEYHFDSFTFIAHRIEVGHRLRLTVGPVNSPAQQRNYNSGGAVADETAEDARTVTVTLHHDATHPSALLMPIAPPKR
jgi:hypothetical protein